MFECCGCCLRAAEECLFEERVVLYEVDTVAKRTEDLFVDDCDKIRYAVVLGNRGPIRTFIFCFCPWTESECDERVLTPTFCHFIFNPKILISLEVFLTPLPRDVPPPLPHKFPSKP